jgi:hypothetical protein
MTRRRGLCGRILESALELLDNLLVVGKIPGLKLRVQEFAIQRHFETAAIRRDQLQGAEFLAEGIHNGFRQAHGLRDIVSRDAIFDSDLSLLLCHAAGPPLRCVRPRPLGCRYRCSTVVEMLITCYLPLMAANVKGPLGIGWPPVSHAGGGAVAIIRELGMGVAEIDPPVCLTCFACIGML